MLQFVHIVLRYVLIACGCLLLGLAALGIVLPILPTTPFVLLAATCFSISSPPEYKLLLRNRFFGPYIEHYRNGGGISKSAKARGIIVLWVLLAVSALMVAKLWLYLVLSAVGIGVTLHLLLIKTKSSVPDRERLGKLEKHRNAADVD